MSALQLEPIGAIDVMRPNSPIAAVQGGASAMIQALLGDFALGALRQGYRIAGVVEFASGEAGGACGGRAVRDLATGTVISISQNLGHGSTACNLDPSGLIEACAAVERAIDSGADLVILSKFGKLEADRRGLSNAFHAAIGAGLPVLTAVSPGMAAAWSRFAGPLSQFIPPDVSVLDTWWSNVKAEMLISMSA